MAATSLWHIKGNLGDLIAYVENPEKTVPKGTEDFFNVFSYIQNPQKTADGSFVTSINCLKQTVLRQMILTKQRYGKEDKYIAWHGYQSFKPGEVTPERCHEIGVKLAQELKAAIPEMETSLEATTDKAADLQRFIERARQVTRLTELTPEIVHEFIEKIVVSQAVKVEGKRHQRVDIHYNTIGLWCAPSPAEMEKLFQEHLAGQHKKTA